MFRASSFFVGLAVAGAITAATATSSAFCRTTTVRPAADDVSGNCPTGLPLFHSSQCLPYRLQTKESPIIPNAVLSEKLARAFATWTTTNAKCTPGITAIELAPVDDEKIADFRQGERGRNVVGVAPTWDHVGGDSALSLATLTFSMETGEVFDVDLEVNGTVSWSFLDTKPDNETKHDLQTVLTHEVGHVLGIAHSADPTATMFASYEPGTIELRTLEADDMDAVCAIYPNRAQRVTGTGVVASLACGLGPAAVTANPCANPDISHGCSSSSGQGSSGIAAAGLFAGFSLILSRLRRVARRQQG